MKQSLLFLMSLMLCTTMSTASPRAPFSNLYPTTSSPDTILFSESDTTIVLTYSDAQEIQKGLIQEKELIEKLRVREAQYIESQKGIMLAQRTIKLTEKALTECEALSQRREEDLGRAREENNKLHSKVSKVRTQRNVLGGLALLFLIILL